MCQSIRAWQLEPTRPATTFKEAATRKPLALPSSVSELSPPSANGMKVSLQKLSGMAVALLASACIASSSLAAIEPEMVLDANYPLVGIDFHWLTLLHCRRGSTTCPGCISSGMLVSQIGREGRRDCTQHLPEA